MKRLVPAALVLTLAAFTPSCRQGEAAETSSAVTPLTVEQVEQLLPFMTDLRKHGAPVRKTSKVVLGGGQTLVQHMNSQAYTFSVWVDGDHHPVKPPSDGSEPVALEPSRQHGTFEIVCIGGCVPNTSNGPACEIIGCEPVDNACGCTPIDCPSCESAGCLAGGSGAFGGVLVMR